MINDLSKFKLMLYLAAIFAAGGVSGWVVAAKTTKQRMFSQPAPREFSSKFCDRVFSNLDLSEEQRQKVRDLADRYDKDMFKLHAQHGRQIGSAVSNRNAQLAAILTPEQRTKFEELERARRESSRGDRNRDRDRRQKSRDGASNNTAAKPPY